MCKVCSMSNERSLDLLEEIASSQHGYVTRAQAHARDISDVELVRFAQRGDLRKIDHGIYKFRGAPDLRFEPVWIAWLRLDPERSTFERTRRPSEIVAGKTAAFIYELGDLNPEPYEFIVSSRRQTRRHDIHFRLDNVERDEREIVNGIPVTRPVRIIRDLHKQHVDMGHIEDIAVDAFQRGLLTVKEIITASGLPSAEMFADRVKKRARR